MSAVRTVRFTMGADSVAPRERQYAGVQGDHCGTVIVFSLGDDLVSPDYIYRVEMVDSLNRYITTENIVLPPGGAEISVPLTREWTRSAGLCEIRVVVSKLNSEFGEELVFHTPAAHIYFDGRVEGVSAEREEGRGLTALIESVRDVSDRAREALDGFSGMVAAALNEAKSYADAAAESKADKTEHIKTCLRAAEIGKSLSDCRRALAAGDYNQQPMAECEGYGEVSLPKDAANGMAMVRISGTTAENIIQNGDFADGIAGWTPSYAFLEVSDKTLSVISNGVNPVNRAYQITGLDIGENQKIYAACRVRLNNSEAQSVHIYCTVRSGAFYYFKTQYEPAAGQWYFMSGIQEVSGEQYRLYIAQTYNDPAEGRVMEIRDVISVNLTRVFGAGNEPTVEQCDKLFADYFEGAASTGSAVRIVSESEDGLERSELYIRGRGALRSFQSVRDEIAYNRQSGQWEQIKRVGEDGRTVLSEPVIEPVWTAGVLLSYPGGRIYAEPVLRAAGVYSDSGIAVADPDYPIDSLERIVKIDFATGLEIPVDESQAEIAADRLCFCHPGLSAGDTVFFTYRHSAAGTQPLISARYNESRYTVRDSVTGGYYRWRVAVAGGAPSIVVEQAE